MGDRTFVRLELRKSDLPEASRVFDMNLEDLIEREEDGIAVIGLDEMNYGANDELQELAEVVPFIGSHEAGGGYGPHNFCAVGGKYHEIEVNHDGHYFMAVDERGKPIDKDAKRKLREYANAEKRARTTMVSG